MSLIFPSIRRRPRRLAYFRRQNKRRFSFLNRRKNITTVFRRQCFSNEFVTTPVRAHCTRVKRKMFWTTVARFTFKTNYDWSKIAIFLPFYSPFSHTYRVRMEIRRIYERLYF